MADRYAEHRGQKSLNRLPAVAADLGYQGRKPGAVPGLVWPRDIALAGLAAVLTLPGKEPSVSLPSWHTGAHTDDCLDNRRYMCLTVLELVAGNLEKVANRYKIDKNVLWTLDGFCSTGGDSEEVRKFWEPGTFKHLPDQEKRWTLEAIKALIKSLGEWDARISRSLLIRE